MALFFFVQNLACE